MIDWPAVADVSLQTALVVAVIVLWRQNLKLVETIINRDWEAETKRNALFQQVIKLNAKVNQLEEEL